jgi:hypothetical protein
MTNTRSLLATLMLGAALALSACHHEGKGEDQRTAAGQVLSGSISDAMLPYDTVRSQPPLAPAHAAANAATDAASAGSSATAADANAAPPAEGDANSPPR